MLATTANATIVDLGTTTGQPADIVSELGRLDNLVVLFNSSNDPDLFDPSSFTGVKTEVVDGENHISLNLSGFDGYFMLKWGPGDHFYYLKDDGIQAPLSRLTRAGYSGDGNFTFYADYDPQSGQYPGLSHYTAFENTPVPEPATLVAGALLLLPFGLSSVKMLQRNKL
jgi:hypothetical protein